MRKFDIAAGFEDKNIQLPQRSTEHSAGYDVEAAETIIIPSIWKKFALFVENPEKNNQIPSGTLVPTGIKAYCEIDEYLALVSRSSNFNKKGLILANSYGVGDYDYVDNPSNDGHLMFNFINFGFQSVVIEKGERIGQIIFAPFKKTDDDAAEGSRDGGFGSTGA